MAQTVPAESVGARKRRLPNKRRLSLRRPKRVVEHRKLPSVFSLIKQSLKQVWLYKKPFIGVVVIYVVLVLLFVKGLSAKIDLSTVREQIAQTITEDRFQQDLLLVGVFAGSGTASDNEAGGLYQSIILVITILATIWLFRQSNDTAEATFKIKQPYYEGMSQLIPFVVVLFIVGLQLIPMLIGLSLFRTVNSFGLAVGGLESVLWIGLLIALSLLTLYLLASSLFALIIVTLPQSTPMTALRSARKIVKYRRWIIIRKLLATALVFSLLSFLLLFAVIATVPQVAEFFALILSAIIMLIIIGCWYKLYRALL